ncbi:MAG: 16S rRNA (cytidine(1402)-2'-O)-methyltransferase [Alphaproteobacteria bacterium]|nr:16S rRNA (cytidine(1402)-2'-O)-methyltransferase [Alphaproteobacteria bacterium]
MPLHVLATPLGNLGDLSPRARETLARADRVAAEDTRVTRKLLAALDIPAPKLVSYRGQDEQRRAEGLLPALLEGEELVLVSDAGTPSVSDPGTPLVRLCHAHGVPVRAIAGPSAVAAALSVSGLPPIPFHFLGFSPKKAGPLRRWLLDLGRLPGTCLFFEGPLRVARTAELLAELLPDREVCLCRELTKLHEEVLLLPAPALAADLAARERVRGEITLVVGPGEPPPEEDEASPGEGSLKEIAAALAARWGVKNREAYQTLLSLEREREG